MKLKISIFGKILVALGIFFFIAVGFSTISFYFLKNHPQLEMAEYISQANCYAIIFQCSLFLSWLIGIGFLISGIGILKLKQWARKLAIFSCLLLIFNFVLNTIMNIMTAKSFAKILAGDFSPYIFRRHSLAFILGLAVVFIIALPILYYLNQPTVKEDFR